MYMDVERRRRGRAPAGTGPRNLSMRLPESFETADPPGQRLPERTMMWRPAAARGSATEKTLSWSPSSASDCPGRRVQGASLSPFPARATRHRTARCERGLGDLFSKDPRLNRRR
jgi:hypothetical protein